MNFNVLKGPFIKTNNDTHKIMRNLIISLIPIILFSFYKNGIVPYNKGYIDLFGLFYPIVFTLTGIITSYLSEYLYNYIFLKIRKKDLKTKMNNSFSIIPGLFVSLILPLNTPIEILILGCIIASIIGKMLYGGFGQNIFNPALIGCLFVLTCYGSIINTNGGYFNRYEVDTIGSATPLTNYKLVDGIGEYETVVKPYGSIKNFLFGNIPGTPGEVCSILIIISYLYLVITKVIKWKIPILYVTTVFLLTWLIGSINGLGIWYPVFSVLSGGLLFGAVFMATDPVTSPTTCTGQVVYALSLGILTVIFRNLTSAPEGVLTSILTMNMFVVLLDRLGSSNKNPTKRLLIPLIVLIVIGILTGIMIGNKYKNPNNTDPNFKLIEKNDNYLIVSQKGNGGPIKAKIIVDNNKITDIKIIESNETESYYKLVKEADYLKVLINNQDNLDDIDTVSGATISSTALKKMIIHVKDMIK